MSCPPKSQWKITASSGNPSLAIDGLYSTTWSTQPEEFSWLQIDLGEVTSLGGLEIYWGKGVAWSYELKHSQDGKNWDKLVSTRHSEGGQNVFAFPAVNAQFVRWEYTNAIPSETKDMVQINLYSPEEAMSTADPSHLAALGSGSVFLKDGESITIDLGYERAPLGWLMQWGETYGVKFGVYLSKDGKDFLDVGQITTGNGDYDSFYWRSTTARYMRLTMHQANSPKGAEIQELKLRILNKDRMPIGQLERAASQSPDFYPKNLQHQQVYWTALGTIDRPEEALFDEYGSIEAQAGFPQLMAMVRTAEGLKTSMQDDSIQCTLEGGSLPIPTVAWTTGSLSVSVTALAHEGEVLAKYTVRNLGDAKESGSLVLSLRPAQINPYWQHGGHAQVRSIVADGSQVWVNESPYAAFSAEPAVTTVCDFENGDVARLILQGSNQTVKSMKSDTALLSAAFEFPFDLRGGESFQLLVSQPMRNEITPNATVKFDAVKSYVVELWREKIGDRKIEVGDPEVSDTVEAQTALILTNATQFALKPGPRNYDRTWIRDGSSQALALLYAGLLDEAKTYVAWYADRVYPNGMVPPILNKDGSLNTGYGSDIEFDAQGQFIGIAAETYRLTQDRAFLQVVFGAALQAGKFIEELVNRTNALFAPETRFYGLMAPSISHEGYNKPSYSYWDGFFALRGLRDLKFLAKEIGDSAALDWATKFESTFSASLARSMQMTSDHLKSNVIYGSADREDFDPTSTSIAFEPCRVEDVLPQANLQATYDRYKEHLAKGRAADFDGSFTPYEIRNLNAFVSLGRLEDAYEMVNDALRWRRPAGWRHWAEVIWGNKRAPEYIGDMPHTWIGAEFATAIRRMLVRENGETLELLRAVPPKWWSGNGIKVRDLPTLFGTLNMTATASEGTITVTCKLSGNQPKQIVIRCHGNQTVNFNGTTHAAVNDLVTIVP